MFPFQKTLSGRYLAARCHVSLLNTLPSVHVFIFNLQFECREYQESLDILDLTPDSKAMLEESAGIETSNVSDFS
jgi:hypothetical protein